MRRSGARRASPPNHTQEHKFSGTRDGPVTYEENFAELFVEEAGVASRTAAELETALKAKYAMIPAAKWPALRAAHADRSLR